MLSQDAIDTIAKEARTRPLSEIGRHVMPLIRHIVALEDYLADKNLPLPSQGSEAIDRPSLTPEKMAELMANEFMGDLGRLTQMLTQMEGRWEKYGQQYQHLLTQEKREQMERVVHDFFGRFPSPND